MPRPTTQSEAGTALFAAALHEHREGRLQAAEQGYRRVLAADPRHAASLFLLGVSASGRGDLGTACHWLRQAATVAPAIASHHASLGSALARLNRLEEAEFSLRQALAIEPGHLEALNSLGAVLRLQGRAEEAAVLFRQLLASDPGHAEAQNNLGVILGDAGHTAEAVACFRAAIAADPGRANAHSNLGAVLADLGETAEAVASLRRAIALKPGHADAHFNLATTLLAEGDLAQGWKEFEWRWQTAALAPAHRCFAQPQWHGEPGDGRTLLIHAEQGFGDTLQFCRYALLAAARGWRVVLEVQPPLVRLLRSLPSSQGPSQVFARGDALPAFDAHCPMLSLPLALGTTLATVPGETPYLHADPGRRAAFARRLAAEAGQRRRVGLVWAGDPRRRSPALAAIDRRRSLDPERLSPLLAHAGICFVSLQKDAPSSLPGLLDWMAEMADFADTAALVANLDLVIAADTAVAHLAGAMGKPVWLLDRFDPCWRWLRNRRDNPWYPSLRIYRQERPGDWDDVISRVAADLAAFAHPNEGG